MKAKLTIITAGLITSVQSYSLSAEDCSSAYSKDVGRNSASFVMHDDGSTRSVMDVLSGLVDMCADSECGETQRDVKNDQMDAQSLSALDFLIGACADSNYYATGSWQYRNRDKFPFFTNEIPDELRSVLRPVKGRITSTIGYRKKWQRMHLGVDFNANVGDTVMAAVSGTVVKTGYDRGGYGLYLYVRDTSGIETRYAHLSKVLVKVDDNVEAGLPLALAGNTGLSTGPHLHFEIRYKGRIVDPSLFFQ